MVSPKLSQIYKTISLLNSFVICGFIWNHIWSAQSLLVLQTFHYRPIHFNILNHFYRLHGSSIFLFTLEASCVIQNEETKTTLWKRLLYAKFYHIIFSYGYVLWFWNIITMYFIVYYIYIIVHSCLNNYVLNVCKTLYRNRI